MRHAFHDDLDLLTGRLVELAENARDLMSSASQALLTGDKTLAASVLERHAGIVGKEEDIETHAFRLLAQQQPVATDLRTVVAAVHISGDLERMGALAGHIGRIAQRASTLVTIASVEPLLRRAAEAADKVGDQCVRALVDRDLTAADVVEASDAVMDTVRTELFNAALDPGWAHGTEAAVRLTQLGRYYERYADHAVKVVRRVVFIETGYHPG